jgi:hypothetical protein
MVAHDYGADAEPADNPTELQRLQVLVAQLYEADAKVDDLEEQLKTANAAARHLREQSIPELMETLGLRDCRTTQGLRVLVKDEVRASLPKDPERREAAFLYLEDSGNGGLIKRKFVVEFNREDEAWAAKFERDLAARKRPLNVLRSKDVHHQTLLAFLREQLREGEPVPMESFGAFVQKVATVEEK